ncbi:MAG: homocysteine S-methyltransferase family protein [Candidatus Marinimicrobia bacterium]|nr:homocysteine S-methyltransferase family protein [Candidatus Neomarinimicrobiota bacterium]
MRNPFSEAIHSGKIMISDGAWGTFLQAEGLKPGQCPESWNFDRPELISSVAAAYIEAGSDMIETNTFGGCRHILERYGLGEKTYALNRRGAELSREAAGDEHYVLGSVGPSGAMLMMGEVSEAALYEDFREQIRGLADGGADALCIETFSALDEAELAVRAAKTTGLPVACTFTFENGFTMMGVTPEQCAEKMLELDVDILGTNCGNGVEGMTGVVKAIRKIAPRHPLLVHANAGLPEVRGGETVFPETPAGMAAFMKKVIDAGATIVGGCCGTTPEHIAAIKKTLSC